MKAIRLELTEKEYNYLCAYKILKGFETWGDWVNELMKTIEPIIDDQLMRTSILLNNGTVLRKTTPEL